jgi:hypothetical protein
MNTIVKLPNDVQAATSIIPANHPDVTLPILTEAVEPPPPPPIPPVLVRNQTAPDLMRAGIAIMEERAREYGAPQGERSVPAIVTAFNAITGHDLTEAQGWLFMQLLKNVRMFAAPGFHRDSAVDGINYCALMAEAKGREV